MGWDGNVVHVGFVILVMLWQLSLSLKVEDSVKNSLKQEFRMWVGLIDQGMSKGK